MRDFNLLVVCAGFGALRGYTILILKSSGTKLSPYDITLVSRSFTTLGQLVASLAMTRLGRRLIFSISGALTGLGLIAFGLSFHYQPRSREPFNSNQTLVGDTEPGQETSGDEASLYSLGLDWLPATFLCFICFSYCLGLGSVPWAYSNELMPADVRSVIYSVTSCLVPLQFFLMTKILPSVMTVFSVAGTFYIFGTFSLLSVCWGIWGLPETRGLSSQVQGNFIVFLIII